jgi:valyl-tRNA synthetase
MGDKKMLIVEEWPSAAPPSGITAGKPNEFELTKNIITAIRNARAENKVEPARKIKAVIYAKDKVDLIKLQEVLIKNLRTGIEELEIKEKGDKIKDAVYAAVGDIEIYLIGAVDKEKEKARIKKEIENLEKLIKVVEVKLNNKEFAAKAPAEIVKKENEKMENWKNELKKLEEQYKNL